MMIDVPVLLSRQFEITRQLASEVKSFGEWMRNRHLRCSFREILEDYNRHFDRLCHLIAEEHSCGCSSFVAWEQHIKEANAATLRPRYVKGIENDLAIPVTTAHELTYNIAGAMARLARYPFHRLAGEEWETVEFAPWKSYSDKSRSETNYDSEECAEIELHFEKVRCELATWNSFDGLDAEVEIEFYRAKTLAESRSASDGTAYKSPKDDNAATFSPWIGSPEFITELMKPNGVRGYAEATIGRKKKDWGAESQPGTNHRLFRFRLARLQELGINYPTDWNK